MNDLINRKTAINALLSAYPLMQKEKPVEVMRGVPSAQPERKKGKWIKISPANIYECSECGKNVMTDDISAYDFCHGCGADMRGDSDEN